MEAGGDALFVGGRGQHVAGDLLDGELVERQVAVERVDHPVAVPPHRAEGVLLVAVAVGVAREVEPGAGPALAVVRRGEQAVHGLLVGVGRGVGEEGIDLLERRRQADQVEREAAEEGLARGLGRGLEPFRLEARGDEAVDRRAGPRVVLRDRMAGRTGRT